MGLVLGLVLGSINFFLLTKLIRSLLNGESKQVIILLLIKALILVGSLLTTAFLMPNQLVWNGVGLAIPLVLGGFIYEPIKQWILRKMKGKHQNE